MAKAANKDRRLMLITVGCITVVIVILAILAPASQTPDPRPTSTNTDPGGAKAAFLLLSELGYATTRWTRPIDELNTLDAGRTTLVLADPFYSDEDRPRFSGAIKSFLERGGRVLATGPGGAQLLPKGEAIPSTSGSNELCHTIPEGPGALARAGSVELPDVWRWKNEVSTVRVEQRCGTDAVIVRYRVGRGEAIWWGSPMPLTNAGLKQDNSLRLFLASIGNRHEIVFDESLHNSLADLWDKTKGLPLNWLKAQAVLIGLLLLLSFSRRRGPVRPLVTLPRTSPIEFADSMGALYEKAGATSAAIEAAQRRLFRILVREAGIAQATLELGPQAIAQALTQRLGGNWQQLATHLETAERIKSDVFSVRDSLSLVKALNEDAGTVRHRLHPEAATAAALQEAVTETN